MKFNRRLVARPWCRGGIVCRRDGFAEQPRHHRQARFGNRQTGGAGPGADFVETQG
jgi:hypothetical protein